VKLREQILIALDSIRANLVRSIITSLIIALGIVALVGVLTSVDGIKSSINQKFAEIGANSFTIMDRQGSARYDGGNRRQKIEYTPILYREATAFKEQFKFPSMVSIYADASGASTVKFESNKTDPNVSVLGIDENYLDVAGYTVDKGRNFSISDIRLNNNFVIIGSDVALRLFKNTNAIGQNVLVGSAAYRVIGVMKEKGSSIGSGTDRMVCIPVSVAKEKYLKSRTSYSINVGVKTPDFQFTFNLTRVQLWSEVYVNAVRCFIDFWNKVNVKSVNDVANAFKIIRTDLDNRLEVIPRYPAAKLTRFIYHFNPRIHLYFYIIVFVFAFDVNPQENSLVIPVHYIEINFFNINFGRDNNVFFDYALNYLIKFIYPFPVVIDFFARRTEGNLGFFKIQLITFKIAVHTQAIAVFSTFRAEHNLYYIYIYI